MKKENNKKGFTLAELLIIVTIIGVLVAISIPIFKAKRKKSQDVINKANIRTATIKCYNEYLADGKSEKNYYFVNAITSQVVDLSEYSENLPNSTYEMPVWNIETGICEMFFVVINDGVLDGVIKTYPYVNDKGEIVFESNAQKPWKGHQYRAVSPRRAFRDAAVNCFAGGE